MSFAVAAGAYDRFMGRYSDPLAPVFADFANVTAGQRAIDVGCGPGALTRELVERVGTASVVAVDPSESFITALVERYPGIEAHRVTAEELPFADGSFDVALAQLVVHFMADPAAGLREMARVARPGAVVAACVWDHGGDYGPLSTFWKIVRELDEHADDESRLPGTSEGDLVRLFHAASLEHTEEAVLTVEVHHASFEDWWEPYTLGVGPAGAYVAGLDAASRERLRIRFEKTIRAPFTLEARAWAARALV